MAQSWALDTRGGRGEIGPYLLVFYTGTDSNLQDFLVFPVAPPNIKATYGQIFSDFEIMGLGETSLRGGDKLAALTFESFFPRDYDAGLVDGFYMNGFMLKAPFEYEQIIHRIRAIGRPVQLIIGGTNINWTCDVRDFSIEHRGGEPGDIYYTIDFKKHRFINLEKRAADAPAPKPNPRPPMSSGSPSIGKAIQDQAKANDTASSATPTFDPDKGWIYEGRGFTFDNMEFMTPD